MANIIELMEEVQKEDLLIMMEVVQEDLVPLIEHRKKMEKKIGDKAIKEMYELEEA